VPADLSTGAPFWNTSGDLGIGTASPGFPLTINRGGGVVQSFMDGGDLRFYHGGNGGYVDVYCDTGGEFKINGSLSIGSPNSGYLYHGGWRGALDRAWDNYPCITIYNHTDRGSQGEFRFHGINGPNGGDYSILVRSDGGFASGSDARRKTDVEPIEQPLAKVLALQGKRFCIVNNEGEEQQHLSCNGRKIGFLAQELIEVVPEVVQFYPEADTPTENGWASAYSVDYASLTALLSEAVKELSSKLDQATATIESLEARLAALEVHP
jgi:hypothetical protein